MKRWYLIFILAFTAAITHAGTHQQLLSPTVQLAESTLSQSENHDADPRDTPLFATAITSGNVQMTRSGSPSLKTRHPAAEAFIATHAIAESRTQQRCGTLRAERRILLRTIDYYIYGLRKIII